MSDSRLYQVEFSPAARKQLAVLGQPERARVVKRAEALAENPRPPGMKQIQGADETTYRIRVGDYRVLYAIRDEVLLVLVVRIGHRREVYR